MSERSLFELVGHQNHELIRLAQQTSELKERVNTLQHHSDRLDYFIEAQITLRLENEQTKDHLKKTATDLTNLESRLKMVDAHLLQQDAEGKTRTVFWGYLRQALPLLWGLCAAMLVLGLMLDDLRLVKLILGQNS